MIGAIAGDIIGSRFEFNNIKTKDFELLHSKCFFTDDTVMSLAICKALMATGGSPEGLEDQAIKCMRDYGRSYPAAGYGGRFKGWLLGLRKEPYNSYGNGAAMRVSGCGFAADSLEEAIQLADIVTAVTHNHPEGMKGAEATAACVYLARTGSSKEEIRSYVEENYYSIDFRLDEIRDSYQFDESCQGTVPQAIEAFLEAESFEDAARNAISIGGDSDTLGAITCSIAGAYYMVPDEIRAIVMSYLDEELSELLIEFEKRFGC